MYILEVAMSNLAKGSEVQIPGLGIFQNGSSYEISAHTATEFQIRNSVPSFAHSTDGTTTKEIVQGESILQAFEHTPGINVRRMTSGELDLNRTQNELEARAPVVIEENIAPVSAGETTGGEL